MNKLLLALWWVLVTVAGCTSSDDAGSGGGISGTGIKPMEILGASAGSIAGFGSIIVNGERFDTDIATFFVNDSEMSQGDLRVGMNVLAAVDFSTNVASQVDYVPSLIGPVESINLTDKSFQSMGQTVRLGGGTTFENLSLSEIARGMVVEVSGFRNATGVIFANFIRPALDPTRFQLVGAVLSDLDNSSLLTLNEELQIDFAGADMTQITTDQLEFGDKVYVTADANSYDPAQKLLAVDSVRVALEPMVAAGDRVEYEGIVSTKSSSTEFTVYWESVIATEQTRVEFEDGTLADLSMIIVNTRVEVEAIVQENGAYLASKIILIDTENSKLSGTIERISPETTSFNVLGLNIQTNDNTEFDGSSDNKNQDIASFSDLAVGDYVEVEASYLGNRLIANDVEVDDARDRAILEGPVTVIDPNLDGVNVINQPILLGAETSYENRDDVEVNRQIFFEKLTVGSIIKVKWDEFQSVSFPPDSLELE